MKKIIILFICLTSSIWHVCAQTKVSGIVKDAQGMEMIGATVLQKGTNNGIVTGLDGKFTLTLSNEAEQLTHSITGHHDLIQHFCIFF